MFASGDEKDYRATLAATILFHESGGLHWHALASLARTSRAHAHPQHTAQFDRQIATRDAAA
jgi:hypothetical protein